MKKIGIVITALAVIGTIAYSQRAPLLSSLGERVLNARMGANAIAELEDGLHMALCGAGSPMAAPGYSGPCVAVIAGKRLYVVDAGTNGRRNLNRMNYSPGAIEAVFLTHFHNDHIDSLGSMGVSRWVGGDHSGPLPVYGPEGVERVVNGFNEAYALDVGYRHAHHGNTVADPDSAGLKAMRFNTPKNGELVTVFNGGGLLVEALLVDHAPIEPAVAYRFQYKGRSILISGDTVKSANLQKFAEGVDILVHEALGMNITQRMSEVNKRSGNDRGAKILHDILDYHTSPVQAAEIARDAKVGHLVYYHIVPPLRVPGQKTVFLDGAEKIFPNSTVGVDGIAFSLPANSNKIIQTRKGL